MKELAYSTLWGVNDAMLAQNAVYRSLNDFRLWVDSGLARDTALRNELRLPWTNLDEDALLQARPPGSNSDRFRFARGTWIQLEPPHQTADDALADPRHRFFDAEPRRLVFTRGKSRQYFEVIDSFRDAFLFCLSGCPPEGFEAGLVVDSRQMLLQKHALFDLMHKPLPHHAGIQRLLLPRTSVSWPPVLPREPAQWFLTHESPEEDGSAAQRDFVRTALATPDLAVLEGPPGSGKTRVICELVLQFAARGEKVLLCSSTHVAVDNVLERLHTEGFVGDQIDAVRVGSLDRIDPVVEALHLDRKSDHIVNSLGVPVEDAKRLAIESAHLVCGTTTGVARPLGLEPGKDRVASPRFDVLILDEASKTPFLEFLVPALYCRRLIIVGDTKQLSPFSNPADVATAIAAIEPRETSSEGRPRRFGPQVQRAWQLLHRLRSEERNNAGLPTLIVEDDEVIQTIWNALDRQDGIDALFSQHAEADRSRLLSPGADACDFADFQDEDDDDSLSADGEEDDWFLEHDEDEDDEEDEEDDDEEDDDDDVSDYLPPSEGPSLRTLAERANGNLRVRIANTPIHASTGLRDPRCVLLEDLASAEGVGALSHLLAADWVFIPKQLAERATPHLPPGVLLAAREKCPAVLVHRHEAFRRSHLANSHCGVVDEDIETDARGPADDIAWRLARIQQLSGPSNQHKRGLHVRAIHDRLPDDPSYAWVFPALEEMSRIGLRSCLEILRNGIGHARPETALAKGLPGPVLASRSGLLTHQHRMQPELSRFSREHFYAGDALRDAPHVYTRPTGWPFEAADGAPLPPRFWVDVAGHEDRGRNPEEVLAARRILERLAASAAASPERREVAVLSFYNGQSRALRDMLRQLTGHHRGETRFSLGPLDIVCTTIDRYQGREADLVILSFRNTRRVGHIDSPSRLNVALTRARHGLALIGRRDFYKACRQAELEALVAETPSISL